MNDTMKRVFNIYCDESSVENDLPFFTIGALLIPREQKETIVKEFKAIKLKHGFKRELKWNKVTELYEGLFKDIIDFFAENNDLEFRAILVEKRLIDMNFHDNDKELMFYKFYYQLLKKRFKKDSINYIFTDFKSRKKRMRLEVMKDYLSRYPDTQKLNISIKHIQEYNSNEVELLQLADFLTGIVSHANNFYYLGLNNPKGKLVDYISGKFSVNLQVGTNLYFEKFNIFKWIPNSSYERN